jgi:hypothetical protein
LEDVTGVILPSSTVKKLLSMDCLQYIGVLSGSKHYILICFDK